MYTNKHIQRNEMLQSRCKVNIMLCRHNIARIQMKPIIRKTDYCDLNELYSELQKQKKMLKELQNEPHGYDDIFYREYDV